MSEHPGTTLAWSYDSGRWRPAADLLPGESDDVMEDLARAGYSESGAGGGRAQEFLRLGASPAEDSPAARLRPQLGLSKIYCFAGSAISNSISLRFDLLAYWLNLSRATEMLASEAEASYWV